MPVTKRMICLANSRKMSGRCIVGRELSDGRPAGWLRPVSARESEEVSEHERRYGDGTDPEVLDIIDVPLIEPRPGTYQSENWLLDPQACWTKKGRAALNDLPSLTSKPGPLWINGYHTGHGKNDEIPLTLALQLRDSLRFIRVDDLRLAVFAPGEKFGNNKRRVQAKFSHAGNEYALWVTDPRCEKRYLAGPDGSFEAGESYLTISLGEPYNERCYKLAAAVIASGTGGAR